VLSVCLLLNETIALCIVMKIASDAFFMKQKQKQHVLLIMELREVESSVLSCYALFNIHFFYSSEITSGNVECKKKY
jgi:hypothetical protein